MPKYLQCSIVFVLAMEGGQGASGGVAAVITPTVTNTTDLTQVLSGLQNSGELTSVLQQQPHLVEGTSKHQLFFIKFCSHRGSLHTSKIILYIIVHFWPKKVCFFAISFATYVIWLIRCFCGKILKFS